MAALLAALVVLAVLSWMFGVDTRDGRDWQGTDLQ